MLALEQYNASLEASSTATPAASPRRRKAPVGLSPPTRGDSRGDKAQAKKYEKRAAWLAAKQAEADKAEAAAKAAADEAAANAATRSGLCRCASG